MQLQALRILHLSKGQGHHPTFAQSISHSDEKVFYLETCQRWIWILNHENTSVPAFSHPGLRVFSGQDAYLFLLRLAAGIESEVLGETDIFGQIKDAWLKISRHRSALVTDLAPWIQRIFEDTKEIRTRFLQNLGGSSYGSLVRKLLREQRDGAKGPTLLVGAGKIAQSVAPFLLESELLLWNRDPERAETLRQSLLLTHPHARIRALSSSEDEVWAWKNSTQIVLGIPLDLQQDLKRIDWFNQSTLQGRSIVHLGGMRENSEAWTSLPQFYCLNDLFGLQGSVGAVRSMQISYAEKACRERAQLRALGGSLSICHGWEDLVCFA